MLETHRHNDEISSGISYKTDLFLCSLIFLVAATLAYLPTYFDFPVERIINGMATKSVILDALVYDFDTFFTLSGAVLVTLIWACWFGTTDMETRARILVGAIASLGAGAISRFFQHALSSHPRPFYDHAFDFHLPSVVNGIPFNTWNSFPSDHAAVFGGLTVVIFLARPRLGVLAAAWFCLLELSRAYMGAHYPTDLVGGASLGAFVVLLAQLPGAISWGRRVALWDRSSPGLFYMCAFFMSYQIATLLQDFRSMTGGVHLIHQIGKLVSNP